MPSPAAQVAPRFLSALAARSADEALLLQQDGCSDVLSPPDLHECDRAPVRRRAHPKGWHDREPRSSGSTRADGSVHLHAIDATRHLQGFETEGSRKLRASPAFALVAAKDGGPAAFVDRREATKLPDTHLKTWESKSTS